MPPPDWPDRLYPGSLNLRVEQYPADLAARSLKNRVSELDRGLFIPEFEIPRNRFGNNRLGPQPGVPKGGDAQVWRALLSRYGDGDRIACWALRRFGSQVGEQLEFVAGCRLRDLGFHDGLRVTASLFGEWREPSVA